MKSLTAVCQTGGGATMPINGGGGGRISRHPHHRGDGENAEMKMYLSKLKDLVPFMPKNRKLSKLEIIQHVIDYICDLQTELEAHPDANNFDAATTLNEYAAAAAAVTNAQNATLTAANINQAFLSQRLIIEQQQNHSQQQQQQNSHHHHQQNSSPASVTTTTTTTRQPLVDRQTPNTILPPSTSAQHNLATAAATTITTSATTIQSSPTAAAATNSPTTSTHHTSAANTIATEKPTRQPSALSALL